MQQAGLDRFAAETRTRKVIQDMLFPVLENQAALQAKIQHDIDRSISAMNDRLERVEYALYKTKKPDTRFDKIYTELSSLQAQRRQDIAACKDQAQNIEEKVMADVSKMQTDLKALDVFKETF